MLYKRVNQDNRQQDERVHEKDTWIRKWIWKKLGRSIAGSVRYQAAFSQSIEGDPAKDEERSFQKGMRNTAAEDGKAIQALNEYLHVYNRDA